MTSSVMIMLVLPQNTQEMLDNRVDADDIRSVSANNISRRCVNCRQTAGLPLKSHQQHHSSVTTCNRSVALR